MATVNVAFCKVSDFNGTAVANSENIIGESITTSGSSQQSVGSGTASHRVVRVSVTGGNIWISIGASPTAAAGNEILLIDGSTEYYAVNIGDKVAVINA